jgi:hypothetical protein
MINEQVLDAPATVDRLDAAAANLPRRSFFSDMPDKGLFACAATLGFFGILLFKLDGFEANYVAAGAVALMLGYGGLAYRLPKVQMRIDRLGDNFYYLGFIYTLASLSAALIQLREGVAVETLLGSFGIALFTTIVGVAGRVIFVQMRGELDDVEERVRRDLLAASADLRSQLSLSLAEFETFQTAVAQAAANVREQSPELASAAIDRISRVAAQAARRIEEALVLRNCEHRGCATPFQGCRMLLRKQRKSSPVKWTILLSSSSCCWIAWALQLSGLIGRTPDGAGIGPLSGAKRRSASVS